MASADHCMAMADEAERLAALVSYGRDKVRLKEQAETWREKARAAECAPTLQAADTRVTSWSDRVIDRLRRGGASRG